METVTHPTAVRALSLVHTEVRRDGVAVLTLDDPRETHNTITPELGAELSAAVDAAGANPRVTAIVLRSAKESSFLVGANIGLIKALRFATDAEEAALAIAARFARIAGSAKPIVACVHGSVLGGGFELALACTGTVATDDPKTRLGLPEVKLGLMPAANGLLRIAERAGLGVAIELGQLGRSIRPSRALQLGLIDEVVAPPDALEASCRFALELATRRGLKKRLAARRAWMRHRGSALTRLREAPRALLEDTPLGRVALFRRARAATAKAARGHYPAPERMLDVLERWASRGFASAAKLEAKLFGELVVSETSHRLIELFYVTTASRTDPGVEPAERARAEVRHVERVAVVGAGLMGAGIACATVQAGLPVRIKDTDDVALRHSLAYVKDVLDGRERRGSITSRERDETLALLSGASDDAGFASADLVIEAVFETLALKQGVIRELDARVKDSCVIASNTSSLPITRIAEVSARPERILGMHYTRPAHRAPLLEIVRTKQTHPSAVATAVDVGKRQGKTVIVVNDGIGFYSTRVLLPYLHEAARLLAEGVPVDWIDRALAEWGFPTGPLHLLDDLGIDVATHVAEHVERAFGERLRVPAALHTLRRDDRRGRKNGRGFYLYGRGRRAEQRVDDTVYHALDVRPHARPMLDEISLRCTLPLVNEALRCLDEGILRSPRDGDVGAIFGLGFPPFRGGPFRYVDVLGAPEVLRRTRSLEHRFGARFEPAPLLVAMARNGRRFYA
jgi:3-hydroxyacyl-CoA dehydrogenase/enoyl-CoA hydratase/3-hydroxybutyryl-CoA epimerase